jgi:hypothetical protein
LSQLPEVIIIFDRSYRYTDTFLKALMGERSAMKRRVLLSVLVAIIFLTLLGCGDGTTVIFASFNGSTNQDTGGSNDGASESRSGLVVVAITDAEPVIPAGMDEFWVQVEAFLVHEEGGKWFSLPLIREPFTLDLLNYHSGNTTDLIRPISLEPGTYDMMRVVIGKAYAVENGKIFPVTILPGKTTIEKDFIFDLESGSFTDLTVDFDLSQSLRSSLNSSYELTPVLHINHTDESPLIHGEIADATFSEHSSTEAIVTVYLDKDLNGNFTADDEEYTRIRVVRDSPGFNVFWLIPEEGYFVTVDLDGNEPAEFTEFIYPADLQKGDVFELNYGILI